MSAHTSIRTSIENRCSDGRELEKAYRQCESYAPKRKNVHFRSINSNVRLISQWGIRQASHHRFQRSTKRLTTNSSGAHVITLPVAFNWLGGNFNGLPVSISLGMRVRNPMSMMRVRPVRTNLTNKTTTLNPSNTREPYADLPRPHLCECRTCNFPKINRGERSRASATRAVPVRVGTECAQPNFPECGRQTAPQMGVRIPAMRLSNPARPSPNHFHLPTQPTRQETVQRLAGLLVATASCRFP